MRNVKQPGFVEKFAGTLIVKLVLAVTAVMYGCWAVVLHVTPSLVPSVVSNITEMSAESFGASVVSTTTELEPEAMLTAPCSLFPQTAGEALEVQIVAEDA